MAFQPPKKDHEPRSVAFRKEREATWDRLEDIVKQTQRKGLTALNVDDLHALPILYRETLSSLSVARATSLDRALIEYLEALSARAYLVVYGSRRPIRHLWKSLFYGIPIAIRRIWLAFLISTGVFALGGCVAWTLTARNPGWYSTFVPDSMSGGRNPWASTKSLRKTLYNAPKFKEMLGVFASHLFSHNTKIGIMCFCLGFFLGIPTLLLLFYNGLVLGAFLAVFHQHGLLYEVLGWLLPHGIPEISAILLCGAAGLTLGQALIFPGPHKRVDALRKAGTQASMIVLGCVFLFFIAALIEGFFRQLIHDDATRYGMASLQALWLGAWILWTRSPALQKDPRMLRELAIPTEQTDLVAEMDVIVETQDFEKAGSHTPS